MTRPAPSTIEPTPEAFEEEPGNENPNLPPDENGDAATHDGADDGEAGDLGAEHRPI